MQHGIEKLPESCIFDSGPLCKTRMHASTMETTKATKILQLKLGGQLIGRLTKSFISFGLGCYEALHKTLQVGFGLWRWRRWIVGCSALEPRPLHRTLVLRGRVLV